MSREGNYREVIKQVDSLLQAEADLIANLANTAACLKSAFDFHWVGFYRRIGDILVLGPFQGPLACTRIPLGKGVCGTSAQEQRSILVPNVEEFPGHIACSAMSKSEIVVPLIHSREVKLVLDVDSDKLDDFTEIDKQSLEEIVSLIKKKHTI